MTEIELRRTKRDRRLYELDGVGTLRLEGLFGRRATAAAAGRTWGITRRGLFGRSFEAGDAAGTVVGKFTPGTVRRGGTLLWADRELRLRPSSAWRERYALADGDREIAILDAKGWGRRPVRLSVADPNALDPVLLLFAAFVVRGLAEDAGSAAAGSVTATSAVSG